MKNRKPKTICREIFFALFYIAAFVSFVTAQQTSKPITNADIIEMLKAGLSESTIILSIQKTSANFDTSPKALIELKQQGATPKILDSVVQADKPKPVEKSTNSNNSVAAAVKKTSVYDFNFELISCTSSGGDSVTCTLTVTNKDKADRGLHIGKKSRMIDEFGNEYPIAERTLGKEKRRDDDWYYGWLNIVLIPEISVIGTVKFEKVKPDSTMVKALRVDCSSNNTQFNVDFFNIPLNENISTNTTLSNNDSRDLTLGMNFYKTGNFEQSYNYLSKVLAQGGKIVFDIKHRHSGPTLGADSDICSGKFIITKDSIEFQSLPNSTLVTTYTYHDFKITPDKIKNITVSPEKWGKLSMRVTLPKKNGKEEEKEFNCFSEEASLRNTSKLQNGQYYEVQCNQTCITKANLIKKLLDEIISNFKQ